MDDFIPAARAGRTVVTNVRGLCSVERVADALGDVPESFNLIYLPTSEHAESEQNREHLARWFHWLPHGAFLLLDEAQMIWPPVWKEKDLEGLDYPGGLEAANAANRPFNWATAFEMHRHYGWDMVLTTPNIDRLRKDVRQVAEGAYKHKNQALIGIKGRYLEAFHMADDSGKSASDFLTLRMRKIKKEVWALYDSTATGTHSDTIAGLSLFANPRILLLLGCLALALFWFVGHGPPKVLGGAATAAGDAAGAAAGMAAAAVSLPAPAAPVGGSSVPADAGLARRESDPLDGVKLFLKGNYGEVGRVRYLFVAEIDGRSWHLTSADLLGLGGIVQPVGDCLVRVFFGQVNRLVGCRKEKSNPPAPAVKTAGLFN